MDVVDLLDPVVLLQRHIIESRHRRHCLEGRLELAQTFLGGVGAHVLVVVEDDQPVLITHRHDRLGEITARPCCGRMFLGTQRVGVDVIARETLHRRDQIGADTLRNDVSVIDRGGIGEHRAAVRAHRYPAHRLHTAGIDQVIPAGANLLRGGVHRFQARCAETIELHPTDGVGHARGDHGGAGDIGTLISDRGDAAQDHVADHVLVEVRMPDAHLVDQTGDQVDRLDLGQCAVTTLATRRTDCLVDESFFGHSGFLLRLWDF